MLRLDTNQEEFNAELTAPSIFSAIIKAYYPYSFFIRRKVAHDSLENMLDTLTQSQLQVNIIGLIVALGAGLLIGIEREQRRLDDTTQIVAGVRTFALIALAGAISAIIGTSLIAVGAGFVAMVSVMSYRSTQEHDPGLTTEVAMFVTFLIGALAITMPKLAAALGVTVALMLALRTRLHRLSKQILSPQELHDALLLIAAALIVLPLLPNQTIDPWNVINPHKLWRLIVLMMSINALGYIAQRALGARLGLPLAGLAGGFVSATATIGAMGARAKTEPQHFRAYVAAASMANIATIAQIAAIFATISLPLLHRLQWPLILSGAAVLVFASFSGIAAWKEHAETSVASSGRAFEPKVVLIFAVLLTLVLIISAILLRQLGTSGALLAAAAAGLADTHAAAGSMAQMLDNQLIDLDTAALGVLFGLISNVLVKIIVSFSLGNRRYGWHVAPGLIALVVTFGLALSIP